MATGRVEDDRSDVTFEQLGFDWYVSCAREIGHAGENRGGGNAASYLGCWSVAGRFEGCVQHVVAGDMDGAKLRVQGVREPDREAGRGKGVGGSSTASRIRLITSTTGRHLVP
jgi:hypothetical protein